MFAEKHANSQQQSNPLQQVQEDKCVLKHKVGQLESELKLRRKMRVIQELTLRLTNCAYKSEQEKRRSQRIEVDLR